MNVIFAIIGLGRPARKKTRRLRLTTDERLARLRLYGITPSAVDTTVHGALEMFCNYWEAKRGII